MTDRAKVIGPAQDHLKFWCPGCDSAHVVVIPPHPNAWEWNGNTEAPTLSPSVLVQGGADSIVCHSFVRDGRIQYLDDSTHSLAGHTVDLGHHSPVRTR